MQSATIAKVRETFWCLICPYPLHDRLVVVGGRWLSRPWLGPGLVRVVCVHLVFLDSSLQSPGQAKHFGILFIPLRIVLVVREIQLSIAQRDNGRPSVVLDSVHSLLFID